MNYTDFFRALINLLYSISKSDHEIHLLEVQQILDIINADLPHLFPALPKETQTINKDLALREFKQLYQKQVTEEEAYKTFISYYRLNQNAFNADINLLFYEMAGKVAYSYKGMNEEEKQFLQKLKLDLGVQ
jgi:hypothetical protein